MITTYKGVAVERLLKRLQENSRLDDSGCLIWTSTINPKGYGMLRVGTYFCRAHRVSYELNVGPIPEGLVIDHLCRVRNCINPSHLEPVTNAENVRRGTSRPPAPKRGPSDATHCVQGHPFEGENLYVTPQGWRRCRTCRDRWSIERKQRALANKAVSA